MFFFSSPTMATSKSVQRNAMGQRVVAKLEGHDHLVFEALREMVQNPGNVDAFFWGVEERRQIGEHLVELAYFAAEAQQWKDETLFLESALRLGSLSRAERLRLAVIFATAVPARVDYSAASLYAEYMGVSQSSPQALPDMLPVRKALLAVLKLDVAWTELLKAQLRAREVDVTV